MFKLKKHFNLKIFTFSLVGIITLSFAGYQLSKDNVNLYNTQTTTQTQNNGNFSSQSLTPTNFNPNNFTVTPNGTAYYLYNGSIYDYGNNISGQLGNGQSIFNNTNLINSSTTDFSNFFTSFNYVLKNIGNTYVPSSSMYEIPKSDFNGNNITQNGYGYVPLTAIPNISVSPTTGTPGPTTNPPTSSNPPSLDTPPPTSWTYSPNLVTSWAIDSQGNLYMWGANNYGQVGNGSNQDGSYITASTIVTTPYLVMGPNSTNTNLQSPVINAGTYFGTSWAVTANGDLYTWGNQTNTTSPTLIAGPTLSTSSKYGFYQPISEAVVNTTSDNYMMYYISNGSLYSQNFNYNNTSNTNIPTSNAVESIPNGNLVDLQMTPLGFVNNEVSSSLYPANYWAISSTGNLYLWGNNIYGQTVTNSNDTAISLFNGIGEDYQEYESPVDTPVLGVSPNQFGVTTESSSPVVQAGVSPSGTVWAITKSGDLYMWGSNIYGELGKYRNTTEQQTIYWNGTTPSHPIETTYTLRSGMFSAEPILMMGPSNGSYFNNSSTVYYAESSGPTTYVYTNNGIYMWGSNVINNILNYGNKTKTTLNLNNLTPSSFDNFNIGKTWNNLINNNVVNKPFQSVNEQNLSSVNSIGISGTTSTIWSGVPTTSSTSNTITTSSTSSSPFQTNTISLNNTTYTGQQITSYISTTLFALYVNNPEGFTSFINSLYSNNTGFINTNTNSSSSSSNLALIISLSIIIPILIIVIIVVIYWYWRRRKDKLIHPEKYIKKNDKLNNTQPNPNPNNNQLNNNQQGPQPNPNPNNNQWNNNQQGPQPNSNPNNNKLNNNQQPPQQNPYINNPQNTQQNTNNNNIQINQQQDSLNSGVENSNQQKNNLNSINNEQEIINK